MKDNSNKEIKLNKKVYEDLRIRLKNKLIARGETIGADITTEHLYQSTVLVLKDILINKREKFKKKIKGVDTKKICYLCMEFLVGRSIKTVANALNIENELYEALSEYKNDVEKIFETEPDPGLGNGGLGRLAACFMDSLSSLDYLANGYTLLFENGLFRQKIIDGEQIELPDDWMKLGGFWLIAHPEEAVTVRFGGKIEERWGGAGLDIINYEFDEVLAIPYDLLIPGADSEVVNKIRLWRADETVAQNAVHEVNHSYLNNLRFKESARNITKQLYPNDEHDSGKLLRLTQQYFLVSASLQSIIGDYLRENGSLYGFEDKIAIHINDTHPALVIPELMRIFMDKYAYSWDDAWNIITKCVSYTNHTVLPEALEAWRVDLFSVKLPRIYMIIEEINKRFTTSLWNLYPGDWDRISNMSIIAYNQIRMASLSIVGSHSVNGVSKLHSEILKKAVFHDFYKLDPSKFKSITNGISHRRWLLVSNPGLSDLLDNLIGADFRRDARKLSLLNSHIDDIGVLDKISEVKYFNKAQFSDYVFKKTGERIDPSSLFDVQIKRLHEYKRQLMNALKILALAKEIKNGNSADIAPVTFIFGCKAAPGYDMAKKIIKLISFISKELNSDLSVKDKIKVILLEDYNVSLAEKLIPAADLSEQISLAGKEASGTGCMKLMINGALTIGTLDGANVEIFDEVGRENGYLFGLNSNEVNQLYKNGYNSREYYHNSEILKSAVDSLSAGIGGCEFTDIYDYLINNTRGLSDPYMCLADFNSYYSAFKRALSDYNNKEKWTRSAVINIANSGVFSADNAIKNYADKIWHTMPAIKNEKHK